MKVLVPVGCRSDKGLSAPVIKRLIDKSIQTTTANLVSESYSQSYAIVEACILCNERPDIVLIFGDRIEMAAAAAACFNHNVPIAHVYAGIGNNIATLDDINRHVISMWSDIQFCESQAACHRVSSILIPAGKNTDNIHNVGITHLDDLKISEELVPECEYDLVLVNPETYGPNLKQKTIHNMITASSFITCTPSYTLGRHTVLLMPNPDKGRLQILDFFSKMRKTMAQDNGMYSWHDNLPRPEFLGLLKHCKRFITNSSAAIYEAPHFLKPEQIIKIGDRNRNRDTGPFETGASDKIVKELMKWSGEYAID